MNRRQFFPALASASAIRLSAAQRPNIVFMLADDLGYGDVGVYGCPDIKTPHLDAFAASGARFTNAYASAPVCSPTRVAFLTGRYQQRAGYPCEDYMGGGCPGLDPREHPTVGMFLKEAGYRTACYGKWNVGGEADITPNAHGFDHWVGFHHNFNYFTHRRFDFRTESFTGDRALYEDGKPLTRPGYIDNLLTDYSIAYINKRTKGSEPFLLYIPWQSPHAPMQAPDDDPKGMPPKGTTPKDRPTYIKIVQNLDRQVGRILQALKETGAERNTLVIFASDNGAHPAGRNLPLAGAKQDLYEGGVRTPFLMRWPGRISAGQVAALPILTLDATATILQAGGTRPPAGRELDGIDLMPYVSGAKKTDPARTLYWRRMITDNRAKTTRLRCKAIREGDWKYLEDAVRGRTCLFNLRDDLGEKRNLLAEEPELAARLRRKLETWEAGVTPRDQRGYTVSPGNGRKRR